MTTESIHRKYKDQYTSENEQESLKHESLEMSTHQIKFKILLHLLYQNLN